MKDFLTLAIFTYPHVKLLLEREHIHYFFENETMVGVFPFYSKALGGILLKVHRLHIQRAKEISESFDNDPAPLKLFSCQQLLYILLFLSFLKN